MVEPVQAFALISVSPVFFCNSIFLVIGLAQCYTYEVYRLDGRTTLKLLM